jgi:Mor family transcriptional regulator
MLSELLKLAPNLTADDFPGKMRIVAEKLSVDDALILMHKVPGLEIYVPASGKSIQIQQYINDHYNGNNALSIAIKLGINSSKVKALAKRNKPIPETFSSIQLRIVATECGDELASKLLFAFPSERIQVPTDLSFLKRKYIKRMFNGSNTMDLAIQLCVTDRWVRKVVSEMYEEKRNPQLSLF